MQVHYKKKYAVDSDNMRKRLLVSILVDTSRSMDTFICNIPDSVRRTAISMNIDNGSYGEVDFDGPTRIDKVNEAIRKFYDYISDDDVAYESCEIMTMSFNDELNSKEDYIVDHFSSVDEKIDNARDFEVDVNSTETHIAKALESAIDLLDERKRELRNAGIECHRQSWLIFFTDGRPSDNVGFIQDRLKSMERSRDIRVCPIGLKQDLEALKGFSTHKPASCDKIEDLMDIFHKLAQSISLCSRGVNAYYDIF